MIAYADLINAFPEFSNDVTYPTTQIGFWIPIAYQQLSADRFGSSLDLAAMLFVAHNIVLSARSAATTASGGVAGVATGPISSKGVGGASMGFDTGSVATAGAGIYNSTSYGQRLYKMMQAFGGSSYVARRRFGVRGYGGIPWA